MEEIWKDIEEFKGFYKVSSLGRVKRLETKVTDRIGRTRLFPERILRTKKVGEYIGLQLSVDGVTYPRYIHRLVATAFIPNPENKPEVNHIDGNKENNRVDNLAWSTRIENVEHAFETGLVPTEKPVNQFTLKGEFVARYKSMMEASRQTGIHVSQIQATAKGEYRHGSGFQWVFDEDVKEVKDIEQQACRHGEGVVKLTLDGEYICEYDRLAYAYKDLGRIDNGSISQVCKGRTDSFLGFKWKYKKDYYKNL